jgi:hypothetical protein
MPRFLFNACCTDPEHCVGVDTPAYVHTHLDDILSLRAVCKNTLIQMNTKNFWVPDLVGKLLPACSGISELAVSFKEIAAADGVRYTEAGYEKIAWGHPVLLCSESPRERQKFCCPLCFSTAETRETENILLEDSHPLLAVKGLRAHKQRIFKATPLVGANGEVTRSMWGGGGDSPAVLRITGEIKVKLYVICLGISN